VSSTPTWLRLPPSGPTLADDPADVIDVVRSLPRAMPPVTATSAVDIANGALIRPPVFVVVVEYAVAGNSCSLLGRSTDGARCAEHHE
jgi:hypothetical protein